MGDLLPCPFCGDDMLVLEDGIEHPASDTCPMDCLYLTTEHIPAWNRRALPSATQAGGWMPPEDREDGFECLGWIPYTQRVGGRWDIVEWFSRPPGWEDLRGNMAAPIAFAPLALAEAAATIARQQVMLDRALEASFDDKARADRAEEEIARLREALADLEDEIDNSAIEFERPTFVEVCEGIIRAALTPKP